MTTGLAGAAAFLATLVFAVAAAISESVIEGDASGVTTSLLGAAVVSFTAATVAVRGMATGRALPRALVASILVACAGAAVGTIWKVPGMLLGVPIAVLAIFAVTRGRWWIGDAGIFLSFLGIGAGIAYVAEAQIHPGTGSYGDQGAEFLAGAGILLCLGAIARTRALPRSGRAAVVAGAPLGVAATVVGALVDGKAAEYAIAIPAGVISACGMLWLAAAMSRSSGRMEPGSPRPSGS